MRWVQILTAGLMLLAADIAVAKTPYVLVTGRRDPRIYAIDFNAALKPENNNTPKAIVSRSWVNPPRLDGKLLGDPANIVLSGDQKTAFVMNHHGAIVNAEFLQHGGRASISVMDVKKMLKPQNDSTPQALIANYDGGWFGGVGLVVLPDVIIASGSEGWLSEHGSNRISLIDRKAGGLRGQIQLALVGPGTRQLRSGVRSSRFLSFHPRRRHRPPSSSPLTSRSVAGRIRSSSPSGKAAMAGRISSRGTAGQTTCP